MAAAPVAVAVALPACLSSPPSPLLRCAPAPRPSLRLRPSAKVYAPQLAPCRAASNRTSSSSRPPIPTTTQASSPAEPSYVPSTLAKSLSDAVTSSLSGGAEGPERIPDALPEQADFREQDAVSARKGTSFTEALLNAVNILLGVGLLSIPFALRQGGWAALAVLAVLGAATNYTGKVLGRCQASMCLLASRPPPGSPPLRGLQSYEDIGEAALGPLGRRVVTAVLYVELLGTCGLFFILEGDNLSRLFGGDPQQYMLLSALLLLPTTWLPDLSALAALGALGAAASATLLGVLLFTFCSEGFPQGPGQTLLNLEMLPFTFGLLSFVYAGHAVFPNIQASMKEPELYPKMLDYA